MLALCAGAAAGYAHVRLLDSSLSVLLVTGATMFLAYRRPRRVWRGAAIMGLSLPAAALLSLITRVKPTLGQVVGSFAGLAFAIVAAFGGQVLQRVVRELFPRKDAKKEIPRP